MTAAELSNLLALVRDSRALGWTVRLGKGGRAIIRKPRGAPWFFDGLLHSYRRELAALLKAGTLEPDPDPDPRAEPRTPREPSPRRVSAPQTALSGPVSLPRVVWVRDHWEVRDGPTEAPRGPGRGSP